MRTLRCLTVGAALLAVLPASAPAQRQGDVDAINRLIDDYGATESAMDMAAQAKLMAPDRVWLAGGAGRRTDQATNMRIQQAAFDALKKNAPGIQMFTEDRDRLIRFYAKGAVAVASFYRYITLVLPPNLPPDVAKELGAPIPPGAVTLVLEKRGDDWKIVHTHVAPLAQAN